MLLLGYVSQFSINKWNIIVKCYHLYSTMEKNICSFLNMCFMTWAGFITDFAESEQSTNAFVYVIIMSVCRDVVGIQISDDVTHKALFRSHE